MNQHTLRGRRLSVGVVLLLVLMVVFTVICIMPFVYMLLLSLTQSQSMTFRLQEISLDLVNYKYVIAKTGFGRALFNSIIIVVFSCGLNCLMSAMAAYGFEKKPIPYKEQLFAIYLATLMIPGQVTLIPVFIIMKKMHLLNTYAAIIIPILNAFGVFLVRQFMSSVPDEIIEAAQVDGCPELKIFFQLVIPLLKPVMISLTVFTFVTSWNNFLWPLVVTTSKEMNTLTVALSLLKTNYSTNYGLITAGATTSFLFPFLLYIFLQKQFVEGIALSGLKG